MPHQVVALEVCQLHKAYGARQVVVDISFSIAPGEVLGLIGPNGAGKSTTIGMIAGLIAPTSGQVQLLGHDLNHQRKLAQGCLGLVPQDLALYMALTAAENLAFWGQLYGLSGSKLRQRIAEVLEFVGLTERERERVDTFSGGMKRRLNLGVALLHRPKVLLLDEPTVGIDPQSRNHLFESLDQLTRQGVAILYTSHYMAEVEKFCDRIAIMEQGQVIVLGTPQKLCAQIPGGIVRIVFAGKSPDLARLKAIPGILQANCTAQVLTLQAEQPQRVLTDILAVLSATGVLVRGLALQETNLETVFLELTGRALRD
jgi:ABC-2 type transport system ATP-binding protein